MLKKEVKRFFILVLLLSSFILLSGLTYAATPASCGSYLNESVTFDSDLNCNPAHTWDGLLINGSDFTIDCAGYKINGSYAGINYWQEV